MVDDTGPHLNLYSDIDDQFLALIGDIWMMDQREPVSPAPYKFATAEDGEREKEKRFRVWGVENKGLNR